jgi:hypothetical protein
MATAAETQIIDMLKLIANELHVIRQDSSLIDKPIDDPWMRGGRDFLVKQIDKTREGIGLNSSH